MLSPRVALHSSSSTSNSAGVPSRSVAEKVTVFPEMDPALVESTGTLNSIVSVAPVDGQGMTLAPLVERMSSKIAEERALWGERERVSVWGVRVHVTGFEFRPRHDFRPRNFFFFRYCLATMQSC